MNWITSIACTIILLALTSCKEKNTENRTEETAVKTAESTKEGRGESTLEGKEYASTYVCPMHCEGSGSEEEGNCPKCGMDYVLNEDHVKDGHKHE